ncbi:MAG: hypothetical protein ACE1ZU_03635, partial [bacterium]
MCASAQVEICRPTQTPQPTPPAPPPSGGRAVNRGCASDGLEELIGVNWLAEHRERTLALSFSEQF